MDYNYSKILVKTDYVEAYDFEVLDPRPIHIWFQTHRYVLYSLISAYLLGIYFGRFWMRNRAPYKLNSLLFIWNLGLAIFSILATIRGLPELSYLFFQPNGMYLVGCSEEFTSYATAYWAFLFALSKFVEFGDTAFIILRKQELIVLHWFHHASMAFGCWMGLEYAPAASRVYVINTFVHSFMYSYYAAKALKIKIPKLVSIALTSLQILQMFAAVVSSLRVAYAMVIGQPCRLSSELLYLGSFLVSSYLILFINFFTKTYLLQGKLNKVE